MRVLHVAPTPFGQDGLLGGGERYPLELARALAPHIECELLTFGTRGTLEREAGGLLIRTLPAASRVAGHPAHPLAPGLPFALGRADIIHAHHMRALPSRLAAMTGRLLGRRVVVTDHGLQGGDWRGLLPRLFHRFLLVSKYSAGQLAAPAHRTRIIYGGVDPDRFMPSSGGTREGVLFVGRLTPHKGVDRLIEALPEGALLRIAGSEGHDSDPPERDYPALLRQIATGRDVQFLGPVPDPELSLLYRSVSVFVLPSVERTCYGRHIPVSELLGLALLEAMASGTPVVASRVGGVPEIVDDGVTGFLVAPGDVGELGERLSQLLADRGLAARMGRAARERVTEEFTWRHCAQRCLHVYQELMR